MTKSLEALRDELAEEFGDAVCIGFNAAVEAMKAENERLREALKECEKSISEARSTLVCADQMLMREYGNDYLNHQHGNSSISRMGILLIQLKALAESEGEK